MSILKKYTFVRVVKYLSVMKEIFISFEEKDIDRALISLTLESDYINWQLFSITKLNIIK